MRATNTRPCKQMKINGKMATELSKLTRHHSVELTTLEAESIEVNRKYSMLRQLASKVRKWTAIPGRLRLETVSRIFIVIQRVFYRIGASQITEQTIKTLIFYVKW